MSGFLDGEGWRQRAESGPNVVALGGGHGLSATLRALRHVSRLVTAIVTVADDGGSSGRLREEFDILPPGDLRMALAALCDDSEWGLIWRDALQHRFSSAGPMNGHALGNLLIASLWDLLDDPIEGLEWVAKLLKCHGRVLPMASQPLQIEADVRFEDGLRTICGQADVAVTEGHVEAVRLVPEAPDVPDETLQAITEADWIILGPGSWYTSVLPHLLVKPVRRAIVESQARRALLLNLAAPAGEAAGLSVADHVNVIADYCPELRLDLVLADPTVVEDDEALRVAARRMGSRVLLRQVRTGDGLAHHDPLRLAAALRDAFEGYWADVGIIEPNDQGE